MLALARHQKRMLISEIISTGQAFVHFGILLNTVSVSKRVASPQKAMNINIFLYSSKA